jgi:hypothetical protein
MPEKNAGHLLTQALALYQYKKPTIIGVMKKMKEINIAEGIGKEILKHLHDYNEDVFMDDSEYIPLIKIIIEAINDHISLYDISKSENELLKNKLLTYARDLYVEVCQINAKKNGEDVPAGAFLGQCLNLDLHYTTCGNRVSNN